MLEHWLIELVGHVSGLSEAQLKQIEKSLPATRALVDLLNRSRPIIEQTQSLYDEAEPLIAWEFPRLCRGGSRSLTYTAVVLQEACDGLKTRRDAAGRGGRA